MLAAIPEEPAIRIIIVDDHTLLRSGLRMLLEAHPRMHVVGEAGNRKEALELASKEQPDVILLDLLLGEDNSKDLIPQLLSIAEDTRILILTGIHDREEHREAVRLGAMGVLIKESSPALVVKAIQKVVAGEFWLDRLTTASLLIDMRRDANRNVEAAPVNRVTRLTEREREVVNLVGEGLRNKQIADRLRISESTVRHHLTSVFEKLEVADRLELVVFSFQNGLLAPRA